jgi:ubiquinol-cytochrome c reductase cytochrome b subunit
VKLRSAPLIIVNEYLVDSPAPRNLNYMWNFGSLLGVNLIILIITGISLAMHYTPEISLAFDSVEHIMRDVNNGWLIRYIHANGAGLFFIWVYLHMGRSLYYGSYKAPRAFLWNIGVAIYLIMMATAFLGYVLPMGQMSLWGAMVITNLLSVIHPDLVFFIWGNFTVANSTLNRFFSLHYLLPFVLIALVLLHLLSLHQNASNNPDGFESLSDRVRFHPYFTSKDLITFVLGGLLLSVFVFYAPNYLGHPDNYIPANPLVTPHSIVPEFYFLAFYAILRAIPNKTLGVLGMFSAILILFALPLSSSNAARSNRYKPLLRILYFLFIFNFLFLIWLGAKPIALPYSLLAQISSVFYFFYFFVLLCC